MNPNSVLSKELRVKPLEKGQVAVYRLIKSNEVDESRVDIATGKKKNKSPGFSLSDRKSIYDRVAKHTVIIGNVTSFRQETMPDRSIKMVPVTSRVYFEPGKNVTITEEQQMTYEFLERCNENASNPYRDPKKPLIFERVDVAKKEINKLEKNELLSVAVQWVSAADDVELKTINESLPDSMKANLNLGFSHIKNHIFELALKEPELVLKASTNDKAKAKIQIMQASRLQIIMFTDGGTKSARQWFWNEDSRPTLLEVAIGDNKYDALVQHFISKEGAKDYKSMVTKIKAFLNYNGHDDD